MTDHDIQDLFPDEVADRLRGGNDVAILPIGSIEQHGPHLPLGTDGFCAQALAQEIANASGGTLLPPVPFSWVGCTNVFAGGIGVREAVLLDYLRAVVKATWSAGFRRIVVVNAHGGNFYGTRAFAHDVFREEGIPVLCIYGLAGFPGAQDMLGDLSAEATEVTGALRLMGREDLVAEVRGNMSEAVAEFGEEPSVQLEPRSAREARRLGVVGHDYSHECLHVQPSSRFDPDVGAAVLQETAKWVAEVLTDFGAYVQCLAVARG